MLATAQILTLVGATVTSGLLTGLFFAFSCAVTPGLSRVEDHTFLAAFRAINTAILNGWFLLVFIGAPLLSAATAALHIPGDRSSVVPWALAAFACHVVSLVITGRVNVPLNSGLELAASENRPAHDTRTRFERRWSRWNHARTVASTGAFVLLVVAVSTTAR